jgi:3-phenylpropionate/trans-cinnamate dioxygenase ferredoxin reductase subunit
MNPADQSCVIIGAGHAAAQLCASLRQSEWPGRITLIGDEPIVPYHRPPLSKSHLDPAADASTQLIRPLSFYTLNKVDLKLGHRVRSIDRETRTVDVGHANIPYDMLVLSTGSSHRRPAITGIEHPRVLSLRTADDAAALRERIRDARRVAIIGAGFIGLEVAASLRKLGREVVVFETADRVLSRVTSPEVSSFFEALHRRHDVDLRTGVSITKIDERGGRLSLFAADESEVCRADLIVLGAGATPNGDLARLAGLETDNGIVVDDRNRTSDPAIYAMGDCCNQVHPIYQTRLRLESVQNATDQAKVVAAAICNQPASAPTLPWFWSEQYDVKLQIAGISTHYDQCVIRGCPEPGRAFSAWYLRQRRLIAVDAINDARAYVIGSKLIPRGAQPAAEVLTDTQRDLKELL